MPATAKVIARAFPATRIKLVGEARTFRPGHCSGQFLAELLVGRSCRKAP